MIDTEPLRNAIRERALTYRHRDRIDITGKNGVPAQWIFDLRSILLVPEHLDRYAELFWERFAHLYPFQVGGMETVGIALVTAIVMKSTERGTPVNGFFIRRSRKKEGLMKDIEGTVEDLPIILVDDIVNSGSTINKQLLILDDIGAHVSAVFTILQFRATEVYRFASARDINITSLFTLPEFGLKPLTDETLVPKDSFRTVWRYRAPYMSRHIVVEKSAPVFHDGRILFGCDDGMFRALHAETGYVAWEYKIGRTTGGKGILSSPLVFENTVYFGGYDGNVYALDAKTGALKWRYSDADWVGSSPCIDSKRRRIYIGLEFGLFKRHGGIVALDADTGAEIWRDLTPALTHSSPRYIPHEDLVVIGSNDHLLYAYRAKDGTRKWIYETGGDIKSACTYDATRRVIAVNSMDGKCHIVDARDGRPLYAKEAEFAMYSSPLIENGIVYTASLDKRLYAFDLDSYSDKWTFETSGRIFASPALIEESVWIGSNDGMLYEIDATNGRVLHTFQTTERILNAPAYDPATCRLFVPTQANEIYCIERSDKK